MDDQNLPITIRPEKKTDWGAIDKVNTEAFHGQNEAKLVRRLRRSSAFIPDLSLVAVLDGHIVGHILFTAVQIKTGQETVSALSLAPMAVCPPYQNQGIGSQLVKEGLAKARQRGHTIVIVVGHPRYYPRFGFVAARAKGLDVPFPVPDEAFMAAELVPEALKGIQGRVEYPPEFDEVIQD